MSSGELLTINFGTVTEETLELIILGHIAKELKDEIQIGRQVNLAKTIMQALRTHDVVGQSEQCCEPVGEGFYLGTSCPKCKRPFRQNLK